MPEIRAMQPDEVEQVFALWNAGCIAAVGTPLREEDAQRVRIVLRKYPDQTQARCFVAVENGAIIGFVTCAVLQHPVLFGLSGEIEELMVTPQYQQRYIKAALVRHAVAYMKQHQVSRIHTTVGMDEPREKAFWRRLGWLNDMTIFSIYHSVPGDPDAQRTWDEYEA